MLKIFLSFYIIYITNINAAIVPTSNTNQLNTKTNAIPMMDISKSWNELVQNIKEKFPGSTIKLKIYGDGIEHKFPMFIESIVQRIQSYFSVYKYTDTSRPIRQDITVSTTEAAAVLTISNNSEGVDEVQLVNTQNVDEITEFINSEETSDSNDYITVGED